LKAPAQEESEEFPPCRPTNQVLYMDRGPTEELVAYMQRQRAQTQFERECISRNAPHSDNARRRSQPTLNTVRPVAGQMINTGLGTLDQNYAHRVRSTNSGAWAMPPQQATKQNQPDSEYSTYMTDSLRRYSLHNSHVSNAQWTESHEDGIPLELGNVSYGPMVV
jgi:hypothetical protein